METVITRSHVTSCCTSLSGARASVGRTHFNRRIGNTSARISGGQGRQLRSASLVVRAEDEPQSRLRREAEPEEYWMDKNTKDGKSPFQDPLAIIGIFAIISPFIILGIAIGTGYVDIGG